MRKQLEKEPEVGMFLVMEAPYDDRGLCCVIAQVTHTERAGFKVITFPDMEESKELISYTMVTRDPDRSVRLATDAEIDACLKLAVTKNTNAAEEAERKAKVFGRNAEKAERILAHRRRAATAAPSPIAQDMAMPA